MSYEAGGNPAQDYEAYRGELTALLDGAQEMGLDRMPDLSVTYDTTSGHTSLVLPDYPMYAISGIEGKPGADEAAAELIGNMYVIEHWLQRDLNEISPDSGQVIGAIELFRSQAVGYHAVYQETTGYEQRPTVVSFTEVISPIGLGGRSLFASVASEGEVRTVSVVERTIPDGQLPRLYASTDSRPAGEPGALPRSQADFDSLTADLTDPATIGKQPDSEALAWVRNLLDEVRSA